MNYLQNTITFNLQPFFDSIRKLNEVCGDFLRRQEARRTITTSFAPPRFEGVDI